MPANVTPPALQQHVITAAQENYAGANHTHLTELLAEREGVVLARSAVRRVLTDAGLSSPQQRCSPRHRTRRQRMPQEGMLLQLDGSPHAWLDDRGPRFTLLLAVDDATGTAPPAVFRAQEETRGYLLLLLQDMLATRGIPLGVYTDRLRSFRHTRPTWKTARRRFVR